MNDRSQKSPQTTCAASHNVTSSPASASGHTPFAGPDGTTHGPSGPAAPPVNHSPQPEPEREPPMNATSGRSSTGSSEPANPLSSSESKSPAASSSESRVCKGCGEEKPLVEAFRRHNKGGFRWTCKACENAWVRTTKPWTSDAKKTYQRSVRNSRRGMALTFDARRRAKARGLPFDLDWRDIQSRIDRGVCEVTGIPFDLTGHRAWNAPSLDQTKASEGYAKSNTRVVLYAVNMMAGTWGLERALMVADAIKRGAR